jgi:RNA polymerase sigma-70 factor (ECF subfamily)
VSIQPLYPSQPPPIPPDGLDEGLPQREDLAVGPTKESRPPATFDAIYEAWFDEVSKWIRALGGPIADRDDLVQEVFVVVHRRFAHFDGQNLPGWLYRITRGKVRDYRRLRWVKRVVLGEREPTLEHSADENNPLTMLATREKQRLLSQLLDELSDTERMAIVLFEVEGYSGQEIAELQGVPLNTVWTRLHKARARLSQKLLRLECPARKPGAK